MDVSLVAVPFDCGRYGVRMGAGPLRLLADGFLEASQDGQRDKSRSILQEPPVDDERWTPAELPAQLVLFQSIAELVAQPFAVAVPIVLAGNCSASIGITAGLRLRGNERIGVCWLDAHADFNTPETTPSGFLDGMALSMLVGRSWPQLTLNVPGFIPVQETDVALVGARDLDAQERDLLAESDVRLTSAASDGSLLASGILAQLRHCDVIYLHVDLDVLDVSEGRANQYACPGGLSRGTLIDVVRQLCADGRVGAVGITAYDPAHDRDGRIGRIAIELGATIGATLRTLD